MKLNDIPKVLFMVFAMVGVLCCRSESSLYFSKCDEQTHAFVNGVSLMSYFEGLMTGLGVMLLVCELMRFIDRRRKETC